MNKCLLWASVGNFCTIIFLICTTAGQTQGVGHPAPAPSQQQPHTKINAAQRSGLISGKQPNKSVIDWFSKYDNIRHTAQMSPSEKENAHKLITAILSGDKADKQAAKKILSSMAARYKIATESLVHLASIPQTSALHKAYLQFFKTGHQFFQSFLQSLEKDANPATLAKLQQARHELILQDVSNKLLDHKLRKQYNIAPYRWD